MKLEYMWFNKIIENAKCIMKQLILNLESKVKKKKKLRMITCYKKFLIFKGKVFFPSSITPTNCIVNRREKLY